MNRSTKKIAMNLKEPKKCHIVKSTFAPKTMSFTGKSMDKYAHPPYLTQFWKDKSKSFRMMYETHGRN